MFRSTLRPHNHEMDRSSNSTGTGVVSTVTTVMEYCLDEGISLSTISQRRMSASFDRRLPSSLERRLSGQGKQHLGHRERAVDSRPG